MNYIQKLTLFCSLVVTFIFADNISTLNTLPPNHVFGTVTPTDKIPGNLDCKGSCDDLLSGGYMKFDLSNYAQGTEITEAKLKIHVLSLKFMAGFDYIYTWICQIPIDPITASPLELHGVIEKQEVKISSSFWIKSTGDKEYSLSSWGVRKINQALSKGEGERWIAMAYTFE